MGIFGCFFGHDWGKYKFIKTHRKYVKGWGFVEKDELHIECKRCPKKEVYIGMTDEDENGYKTPYTFKH
jgi:hypothetical protein